MVNNDQLISASKDLYDYIQEKNYTEGFETFEKYRERNLYELWRRVFYAKISHNANIFTVYVFSKAVNWVDICFNILKHLVG